jgi:uncharacterized protein
MKFSLDSQDGRFAITAYSADGIRVGEDWYRSHLLLTAEQIIAPWAVPGLTQISAGDFEPISSYRPEVILLGTGSSQHFPSGALLAAFARQGIGLEVMATQAACRTYNILLSEGRRVAAGLLQYEHGR